MTYLVDSDWVIDALHGVSDALGALERNASDGLAVSIVTYGEVYDGAYGFPDPERHLASFRAFLSGYDIIGLTDPVMEFFAKTRFAMRRQGNIIPDLDLLIGATAVVNGFTLMTRNLRHFERVPGLKLSRRASTHSALRVGLSLGAGHVRGHAASPIVHLKGMLAKIRWRLGISPVQREYKAL